MTAPTAHARRRLRFAKARAPVAIAMRALAASVVSRARDAGAAPAARRSVFVRRAAIGLAAPVEFEAIFGTVAGKDLH